MRMRAGHAGSLLGLPPATAAGGGINERTKQGKRAIKFIFPHY